MGSKIIVDGDCSHEISRHLLLGRKTMTIVDGILKSSSITLPAKVHIGKTMVFPEVMQMSELDHKEGWVLKNLCFRYVVLEKTLESPLDCKEIKPANPKGNQPWIFTGRIDPEAEAPILWPPDAKSQLTGNDADAGKDWGQQEKRATENEMVGWHHQLNWHAFARTPGDSEGQRSLVHWHPWGRRVRHGLLTGQQQN